MRQLVAGLILALLAGAAIADGKFYSDRIPPGIPYQRAILTFDGGQQTLLIESKLHTREGERFGWVVPAPTLPELASPAPGEVDLRYSMLEKRTRAREITGFEIFVLLLLLPIAYLVVRAFRRERYGPAVAMLLLLGFMWAAANPSYMGVQVLKEERVGPYDAKVIQGGSSVELIDWLKGNGFRFDERDRAAIDAYVARKWLFVTAKLDAGAKGARGLMVPPLEMKFPARQAVYPLALTATAGQPVEILLYVTAPWRADAGGRLPVEFAGDDGRGAYLTKFRGVMTPEQMREDLVLGPAQSNAAYRRWQFRW